MRSSQPVARGNDTAIPGARRRRPPAAPRLRAAPACRHPPGRSPLPAASAAGTPAAPSPAPDRAAPPARRDSRSAPAPAARPAAAPASRTASPVPRSGTPSGHSPTPLRARPSQSNFSPGSSLRSGATSLCATMLRAGMRMPRQDLQAQVAHRGESADGEVAIAPFMPGIDDLDADGAPVQLGIAAPVRHAGVVGAACLRHQAQHRAVLVHHVMRRHMRRRIAQPVDCRLGCLHAGVVQNQRVDRHAVGPGILVRAGQVADMHKTGGGGGGGGGEQGSKRTPSPLEGEGWGGGCPPPWSAWSAPLSPTLPLKGGGESDFPAFSALCAAPCRHSPRSRLMRSQAALICATLSLARAMNSAGTPREARLSG